MNGVVWLEGRRRLMGTCDHICIVIKNKFILLYRSVLVEFCVGIMRRARPSLAAGLARGMSGPPSTCTRSTVYHYCDGQLMLQRLSF